VSDDELRVGGEGWECGEGEGEDGAKDGGGGSFHICCYSENGGVAMKFEYRAAFLQ
jgi:hypothetical protein